MSTAYFVLLFLLDGILGFWGGYENQHMCAAWCSLRDRVNWRQQVRAGLFLGMVKTGVGRWARRFLVPGVV
eukprot:370320-Pyramimonas_sp.AAC.1